MFASAVLDVRYALRAIVRRPLFSLILVSILALGLGVNAAMFSVVDSVLLEPLPYPDADRLVWMQSITPDGNPNTVAALDWMDYREQTTTLEELAAYSTWPENIVITGGDEPEVLTGAAVSSNFFRTLGVGAVFGRGFVAEDEDPGSGDPVVLSHGLWQRRFGGDPGILGRTVSLEGRVFEVVGVMPAGFAFPSWAELWRPFRMEETQAQGRGNNNFRVFGRLAPSVSVEGADAEFATLAAGIAAEYPDSKQDWSAQVVPILDVFVGDVRSVLWMLLGAVGLALLIACANVAALMLARATRRQAEVAVRVAIGASRGRIARQMLTESVITALVGGVLGLAVAFGALEALAALGGGSLPRLAAVEMDGTALLFMLAVSLVTGVLFGLAPAVRGPKLELAESLKEGGRGLRGSGSLRLQSGLVIGQVALSLTLLVGSGLLIRSFVRLQQEEMGFQPEGVLTAELRLPRAEFGPDRHPNLFYEEAVERVRALPGVKQAGIITRLPVIGGNGPWNYVHADTRPPATMADRKGATRRVVGPGYFEAMGIPLLQGRAFDRSDGSNAALVAVISRRLADEFFPGEDPLGRSIALTAWSDPPPLLEVVGVVGDVSISSLDSDTGPTMYWPLAQHPRFDVTIAVRAEGDPAALAPALREAIRDTDPNVPVSEVQPMTAIVSSSLAESRFRTVLLGAFAGMAVLLASLGLYGVLAQLVGGRTQELGVRIALGARPANILGWVMRHALRLTVAGLAIGVLGAAAATYAARGLLFGVEPLDPPTYVGTLLALTAVALAAALIPALRATRVDPVQSLRAE
jgi:predicted permease